MIKFVEKKDCRLEAFDAQKIKNGIFKAVQDAGGTDRQKSDKIGDLVLAKLNTKFPVQETIKYIDVLDAIEETLIKGGHDKVARSFILYRYRDSMLRKPGDTDKDNSLIKEYIDKSDWAVKENSNMGYSLQGLNFNMSSKVTQNYWLTEIYPAEISKLHVDGDIHIHDLGILGPYCFSGDTKVPLADGTIKTMKQLTDEYKDKNFEVFSIDEKNNIVVGTAYNPRLTRKNTEVIEVTLDNNKKIICTPDHPFMLRNGTYKNAELLTKNESLMPAYIYNNFRQTKYKGCYNPGTNKDDYLHRILKKATKEDTCHHINGIKTDNRLSNIEVMKDREHKSLEMSKIMNRPEMIEKSRQSITLANKSEKFRNLSSKRALARNKTDTQKANTSYYFFSKENIIDKDKYFNFVKENGFIPAKEFVELKNHKVKSIRKLKHKIDVYDLSVEKYHNFALDVGVFVHNCVGWDLQALLLQGFNGVPGKISSGPAKHLRTALGQAVNFIFTMQGEAAGAQAFSNFDTLLAPFIKKDNLDREQVKQALQEFLYGMNVSTRVGFQCPFSNITLDVICPEKLRDKKVVIENKELPFTFGACQEEMDLFNDVFCELMIAGDYQSRLFSFPIPTYNIHKNFEWDNPRYSKIWEMTAKYGIPYFANYVNSDMDPDQATSMCCRLRIDRTQLEYRGGGLFGSSPNTGSIGVVTINLPRIGYTVKTEEEFFKQLDKLIDASKESLLIKTKLIERLTDDGLYPYSRVYLAGIKDNTKRYWSNHFLTIGLLGMNEALINFIKKDLTTKEGNSFAEKVLLHMREKITQYQKDTGYLFNLEATPGEGTTRRFANIDKKKFPSIIVANEVNFQTKGSAPYYTNSTQMPVNSHLSLFKTLELENNLQPLYTGGTVLHIFAGEKAPDPNAVKILIKKCCENYKIPYFSFTPTFSICKIHGYLSGEHHYCNICATPAELETVIRE